MSVEEDGFVHKLVISNPTLADGGKYTVDVNGILTEAYLEMDGIKCINFAIINKKLHRIQLKHRILSPLISLR